MPICAFKIKLNGKNYNNDLNIFKKELRKIELLFPDFLEEDDLKKVFN